MRAKKVVRKVTRKLFSEIYAKNVEIHTSIEAVKKDTESILENLASTDRRLEELKAVYAKADPYQPLYGVAGVGTPQRESRDRCDALFRYFNNDVKGVRFLDVGCFFGYLSFYLAERGAKVDGWDNNDVNIDVAHKTRAINGIDANFSVTEFSPATVRAIPKGTYDVVLIYSVLHWLIALYGLEYVQECMKQLFESVPVVIVELAQKGEDKKLFWDKAVPKNDIAIFDTVKGVKIEKLGEFPTHLSAKNRPVYIVYKDKITVNNKNYSVDEMLTQSYPGATRWRNLSSQYYRSNDYMIKQYNFSGSLAEANRYVLNEINFYLQNSSDHNHTAINNISEMVDYEIGSDKAVIVLKKIEGELLKNVRNSLSINEKIQIIESLLKTFADFEKNGLYHNDIRSWNIMIQTDKMPVVIDMEMVSSRSYENNAIALLWVVHSVLVGKDEAVLRNKTNLPDKSNFLKESFFAELYSLIANDNSISFRDIIDKLKIAEKNAKATGKK